MAPCVLYQNEDKSITLFDIPKSIEVAQGFHEGSIKKSLLSSLPIEQPYLSTEPRSAKAVAKSEASPIQDLLLQGRLHFSLEEVETSHRAPWYLPRTTKNEGPLGSKKQRAPDPPEGTVTTKLQTGYFCPTRVISPHMQGTSRIYHNENITGERIEISSLGIAACIPPRSTFILGNIEDTLSTFHSAAPKFDVVVMDPPWPNRSARRKKSYNISYNTRGISTLLSSIPLNDRLTEDGLVGIWITNKSSFRDLVLKPDGLFEQWGLELVEEWIWLKVTVFGVPICRLDSKWRKPYEILLLGRKASTNKETFGDVKRRVIIGVPDLHSRKPNLKALLEPMLPCKYEALEIFARNLTSKWWAWGNEVLKFQGEEYWVEE